MDRIDKSFKKLDEKEKLQVKKILTKLLAGDFKNLDIKKLKGKEDIFRVRNGSIRIIYRIKNKGPFILLVERRNDKTYRLFI